MLRLASAATRFKKRPSEIAGITSSYTAFCFDEAANILLNLYEQADDKKRKMLRWSDILTEDGMVKGSGNEAALQGFLEQYGNEVK